MRKSVILAIVAAVVAALAAPALAATTTTTVTLRTTTTTTPHRTTTTTAPHRTTTTTAPHRTTTTAEHRAVTRHRGRRHVDYEVVLGITRTRGAAEALVARARRHGLHPVIEREDRGRHFEVEVPGFSTKAAAEREVRVAKRDGFRAAHVERS